MMELIAAGICQNSSKCNDANKPPFGFFSVNLTTKTALANVLFYVILAKQALDIESVVES